VGTGLSRGFRFHPNRLAGMGRLQIQCRRLHHMVVWRRRMGCEHRVCSLSRTGSAVALNSSSHTRRRTMAVSAIALSMGRKWTGRRRRSSAEHLFQNPSLGDPPHCSQLKTELCFSVEDQWPCVLHALYCGTFGAEPSAGLSGGGAVAEAFCLRSAAFCNSSSCFAFSAAASASVT